MSASLVGSEMCIRDRLWRMPVLESSLTCRRRARIVSCNLRSAQPVGACCLLYTSDAADDM
eukprot:9158792-Alexandrium_andersonii.AAC.1